MTCEIMDITEVRSLSNQLIPSLSLSRKLEIILSHLPRETSTYWVLTHGSWDLEFGDCNGSDIVSTYTIAELIDLLPKTHNGGELTMCMFVGNDDNTGWRVSYVDRGLYTYSFISHQFLADALAMMLLDMYESKHITFNNKCAHRFKPGNPKCEACNKTLKELAADYE